LTNITPEVQAAATGQDRGIAGVTAERPAREKAPALQGYVGTLSKQYGRVRNVIGVEEISQSSA